jgi:hypothetical protein
MEEWRDIPGYEGLCKVSDLGNVLSVRKNKNLKPGINSRGYSQVNLYSSGKRKCFVVHQLAAICFMNHKPDGLSYVVDHINNLKTDNRVENLQVVSNRVNCSKDRKGSSRHTGVCYHKKGDRWVSNIYLGKENIYLGCFKSENEASKAYQDALKKYNLI